MCVMKQNKNVNKLPRMCSTDWKSYLRLTNTRRGMEGHEAGTSLFVFKYMVHIAGTIIKLLRTKRRCVSFFLCCREASLQQPCIQSDIGNGAHFVPSSRCAKSYASCFRRDFGPHKKCFRKNEHVKWGKLSLRLVPSCLPTLMGHRIPSCYYRSCTVFERHSQTIIIAYLGLAVMCNNSKC